MLFVVGKLTSRMLTGSLMYDCVLTVVIRNDG
jgi:hypothetical protein